MPTLLNTPLSGDHAIDHKAFGQEMKRLRWQAMKKQKEVAAAMGISAGFLCDLEYGRRNWLAKYRDAFLAALKPKKKS